MLLRWRVCKNTGAPLGQPPAAAAGRDAEASAGQAGSGSGQEVLMPPQRRNWKRCASHVYIAHFIEYQIHKDRCVWCCSSCMHGNGSCSTLRELCG
jgi:hypothetical protein